MAVLPLVIAPDERLNQPSAPVEKFDDAIRKLCDDMLETMYANQGLGLAAVQVGVHKRIVVVDVGLGSARYRDAMEEEEDAQRVRKPMRLINPEILEFSEEQRTFTEGCLSFPDNFSEVERPATITVQYQNEHGDRKLLQATGLLAICIQHEIDHTNGIVFVDHISKLKRDMILKRLRKQKKLGTLPTMEEKPVKL